MFASHAARFALFAAVLSAGCAPMIPDAVPPSLDGTAWVLAELTGRLPAGGQRVTLSFAGGRASGSDACNRYTVPYTASGAALAIGPRAAVTQMACAPEVMKHAAAYLGALEATRSYRVVEGRLQLLGADGALLAAMAPQPQTVGGTSWRVTGINNGRGAVASVVSGTTVTLVFDDKGQASGSAGCNRFSSRYEADGAKLRFSAPATTRMMCGEAGVMEQEQAFVRALESAATMRIEGGRLELRRADGALAISAQREGQ